MICNLGNSREPTSCQERQRQNLSLGWLFCKLPEHPALGVHAWPHHTVGVLQQGGCQSMNMYTDIKTLTTHLPGTKWFHIESPSFDMTVRGAAWAENTAR